MTVPLIMDCDTGIDDTLALLYLAASPQAEVIAIGSVWGNTPSISAANNTLRVLEVAGMTDIPVCVGASHPLVSEAVEFAGVVHGSDGMGNLNLPAPLGSLASGSAAEQLVRLTRARPGELTILATGPLTNLAIALQLEPQLAEIVRAVVIMGGAFDVPGNATPLAEANIWHDPESAAQVFAAPWPVRLVGLDVTMTQTVLPAEVEAVRQESRAADFAWRIMQHYFDFYEQSLPERSAPAHDMVAAMLAIDPDVADYEEATVHVETAGLASRGATYVDRRSWVASGGNVAIARRLPHHVMRDELLQALVALP